MNTKKRIISKYTIIVATNLDIFFFVKNPTSGSNNQAIKNPKNTGDKIPIIY